MLESTFSAQLKEGGPNDYYDSSKRVQEVVRSVNALHLDKAISNYNNNKIHLACMELEFTLRWFPNHPRGLQFAAELFSKHACPGGKNADDYFNAALDYRPNDGIIHALYGIYLHKTGSLNKALKQYESALTLIPDAADLHYNMGLLFIEMKNYDDALKHAQKAYEIGHPLPGLKNKLVKLKVWPSRDTK